MTEQSQVVIYQTACALRTLAERKKDPETYRLAADKFRQAGFVAAAQRCQDRADHYEAEL